MLPGTTEPTRLDSSAEERSARDAWCESSVAYFCEACATRRTDPTRSLERLRMALEGWAHAVRVATDPEFKTHERGEPRRLQLAPLLQWAAKVVPPAQSDLARKVKILGDSAHHNQGVVQQPNPRIVAASLQECAALLEWLFRDLLATDLPPPLRLALDELEGGAVSTPQAVPPQAVPPQALAPQAVPSPTPHRSTGRSSVAMWVLGLALFTFAGAGLLWWQASSRGRSEADLAKTRGESDSTETARDDVPVGPTAAGSPRAASASETAPPRDLAPDLVTDRVLAEAWVQAYDAALRSHDVERVVALHTFPMTRFFMVKSASERLTRRTYEDEFAAHPGSPSGPYFSECRVATPQSVRDSVTLVCGKTCLSFTREGKLSARFDIGGNREPTTCPE